MSSRYSRHSHHKENMGFSSSPPPKRLRSRSSSATRISTPETTAPTSILSQPNARSRGRLTVSFANMQIAPKPDISDVSSCSEYVGSDASESDYDKEQQVSDKDTDDAQPSVVLDKTQSIQEIRQSDNTKQKLSSSSSLIRMAHRTMNAIVTDRESDTTRYILLHGDAKPHPNVLKHDRFVRDYTRGMLSWPSTGIYRYIDHIREKSFYPCMGVDPMRACEPRFVDIDLEEPAAEWDTKQIAAFEDDTDDDDESNDNDGRESDSGYTGVNEVSDSDGDEAISDSTRNGGIGLVIRRTEDNTGSTRPQFLTAQQLYYPELLEPRYNCVPLPDEFNKTKPTHISPHYQPLIDMTRAQVLNQALRRKNTAGSPQPALSEFVSQTVAHEAVSGVVHTWEKLRDLWSQENRDSRGLPFLGTVGCGWITMLNSALAAGIPEEVVARAYHRLVKLCDVSSQSEDRLMANTMWAAKYRNKRKYIPKE